MLLGEFLFLFGCARPRGVEPAGVFVGPVGVKNLKARAERDVLIAKGSSAKQQGEVDCLKQFGCARDEAFLFGEFLFRNRLVAALDAGFTAFQISWTDLDADRYAFFDPVPFFDTAIDVARIDMDAERIALERLLAQACGKVLASVEHRLSAFLLGRDWQDDNLLGGNPRWEDETVIIRVGHDKRADETGRNAP